MDITHVNKSSLGSSVIFKSIKSARDQNQYYRQYMLWSVMGGDTGWLGVVRETRWSGCVNLAIQGE